MPKKLLLIVGALVVAAGITAIIFFGSPLFQQRYSYTNTPNDVLLKTNDAFANARTLQKAGDYRGAIEAYNQALLVAQDTAQQAQIKFDIAAQHDHMRDYVGAVRLFKEIADDPKNNSLQRAYAVQWMADINNQGNAKITKEVFSTSPYKEMVVKGNTGLTNRHLAEYASSFYPLGLTEMYIAIWYAGQLTKTPPPANSSSYLEIINSKIKNAEKDIERTKLDSVANAHIPDILVMEAIVKSDLARAGAGAGGDAEAAFQRASAAMAAYGFPPWYDEYLRLNYGIFLALMYGDKRQADIHTIVFPIYENSVYKNAPIVQYLKDLRKRKHPGATALSKQDAGFQKYLMSLGWSANDLK